jgi:hypothetical protein
MSVVEDSVLGDATGFRVKNDVNLLPGVWGFLLSTTVRDLVDELESVRRGGGLVPGLGPMSSSKIALSTKKPFDRFALWLPLGELVCPSVGICVREPFVLGRVKS